MSDQNFSTDQWIKGRLDLSIQKAPALSADFKSKVLRAVKQNAAATTKASNFGLLNWIYEMRWILLPLAAGAAAYGIYQLKLNERHSTEELPNLNPTSIPSKLDHSSLKNSPTLETDKPSESNTSGEAQSKKSIQNTENVDLNGKTSSIANLKSDVKTSTQVQGVSQKAQSSDGTSSLSLGKEDRTKNNSLTFTGHLSWKKANSNQVKITLDTFVVPNAVYELERSKSPTQDFIKVATLSAPHLYFIDQIIGGTGQYYRARAVIGEFSSEYTKTLEILAGTPEPPLDVFALPLFSQMSNEVVANAVSQLLVGWKLSPQSLPYLSEIKIRVTYPNGEIKNYSVMAEVDRILIEYRDLTRPSKIELISVGLTSEVPSPQPLYYCPGKMTPGDTVVQEDVDRVSSARSPTQLPVLHLVDPINLLRDAATKYRANINGDRLIDDQDLLKVEALRDQNQKCPF